MSVIFRQKKLEKAMEEEGLQDEEVDFTPTDVKMLLEKVLVNLLIHIGLHLITL